MLLFYSWCRDRKVFIIEKSNRSVIHLASECNVLIFERRVFVVVFLCLRIVFRVEKPFRESTWHRYGIQKSQKVRLRVENVRTLFLINLKFDVFIVYLCSCLYGVHISPKQFPCSTRKSNFFSFYTILHYYIGLRDLIDRFPPNCNNLLKIDAPRDDSQLEIRGLSWTNRS